MTTEPKTTFEAEMTQFLRPDGREKQVRGPLPLRAKEAYDEMLQRGYRLETEVIPGNELYVSISDDEGDLDNLVEHNGPNISAHIADMLERWLKNTKREEEI